MISFRPLLSALLLICSLPVILPAEFSLSQKATGPGGSTLVSPQQLCGLCNQQVRLIKNEIMLGEPLILEIIITPEPSIRDYFDTEFTDDLSDSIELYFQSPTGDVWKYEPVNNPSIQAAVALRLGPGETYRHQVMLSYDSQSVSGSLFDQPGAYNMLVRMKCTDPRDLKWIEFQPLPIVVNAPTPEGQDMEALKLMVQTPEFFQSFQTGITLNPNYSALLETIVQKYPQSVYYPYALYALALRDFKAYNLAPSAELLTSCQNYIMKVKDQFPDHGLAYRALLTYQQTCILQNKITEADNVFLQLWQSPQYSNYFTRQEFKRVDEKGKAIDFVLKDWMIFERPEDGFFTSSELFTVPSNSESDNPVPPVDLDIPMWGTL